MRHSSSISYFWGELKMRTNHHAIQSVKLLAMADEQ